jgi:Rieske Fe-S protein
MVAAFLIRDTICKIPNSYAKVFSPQRIYLKAGFKHWITDFGVSTKGLFYGWIVRRTPRCSHMGCGLVWNQVEKTWECPCHGSRFDEERKLLDNPSKKNLS